MDRAFGVMQIGNEEMSEIYQNVFSKRLKALLINA